MAENRCVSCGEIIPEGMIACPNCLVVSKKKTEMKPCPFCGGKAALSDAGWKCKDKQKRYTVRCEKCGTSRCVKPMHLSRAIAVWNERYEDG